MTLNLPAAVVRQRSGRPAFAPSSKLFAFAGVCSDGPFTRQSIGSLEALHDAFGFGPAVKAAAYELGKAGAPILMRRIPATTVTADIGDPDLSDWDGAAAPALSGTPNDYYSVIFDVPTPGELGTATRRYSVDGGENYSATAAIPMNGIVALTDPLTGMATGITVTLTAGTGNDAEGSFTFEAFPASQSITPVVSTRVGTSTSVVTITGTPLDAYEIVLEVLVGGTIGESGIVVRYSLDGERSWSKPLRLGTDNGLQIDEISDAFGNLDSGLDFAFAAGTLDAGDTFAARTTEPAIQASDVETALDDLDASTLTWRAAVVVGAVDATAAGTISAKLTDYAENDLGNARYANVLLSTRSKYNYETETAWENDLVDDFDGFENAKASVGAGYARITCPITKRRNRRPVAWVAVPELVKRPIEESIARKATGALSSDVQLYEDDVQLEHDARVDPTLQGERFLTLRTYKGQGGVYFTRDSTMDVEGGLEGLIARRQVLDLAADVFRIALEDLLMDGVEVNAADEENPGCITEENAARIDAEVERSLRAAIQGKFSAISVHTSRTTVLAAGVRLPCTVSITGLEYIDGVEGTIGYTSAALQALAA